MFDEFDPEQRFREAWEAVEIVRPVRYSLFTFGATDMPYYLIAGVRGVDARVSIAQGEVRIDRPMILRPDSAPPELRDIFDDPEDEGLAQFLLARTARFSNLRIQNQRRSKRDVDESVEAAIERLTKQLDNEEEDRVAILAAPPKYANFAVFRYATQRVMESGPDNIQELRERGFLP